MFNKFLRSAALSILFVLLISTVAFAEGEEIETVEEVQAGVPVQTAAYNSAPDGYVIEVPGCDQAPFSMAWQGTTFTAKRTGDLTSISADVNTTMPLSYTLMAVHDDAPNGGAILAQLVSGTASFAAFTQTVPVSSTLLVAGNRYAIGLCKPQTTITGTETVTVSWSGRNPGGYTGGEAVGSIDPDSYYKLPGDLRFKIYVQPKYFAFLPAVMNAAQNVTEATITFAATVTWATPSQDLFTPNAFDYYQKCSDGTISGSTFMIHEATWNGELDLQAGCTAWIVNTKTGQQIDVLPSTTNYNFN